MPESMTLFRTIEACSSGYMRKRLPQPMARMDTLAPVRPRVRCGSFGPTAASGGAPWGRTGIAATAPTARPLFSRNSRRLTLSSFDIGGSFLSGRLHPDLSEVLAHGLGVLRERDLGLLDLGVPLLLPLEAVEALVPRRRED